MVLFSAYVRKKDTVPQSAFDHLKLDFWGEERVILDYYLVG